jgi:peptidyl-dipeptidase A
MPLSRRQAAAACALVLLLPLSGARADGDAAAFVAEVEAQMRELYEEGSRLEWVNSTYITYDTNWLVAKYRAESTRIAVESAKAAARFDGIDLPEDLRRKLDFLKNGVVLPASAGAEDELAEITTRLDTRYATGRIDLTNAGLPPAVIAAALERLRGKDSDLSGADVRQDETELLMRQSRDPALLAAVWTRAAGR